MSTLLLVLTLVAEVPAGPRPPAGWVVRDLPADGSPEWSCASTGREGWAVSAEQGRLQIAKGTPDRGPVSLQFTPKLAEGEAPNTFRGASAAEAVSEGFLAGFNRGESGGGLYWFSQDGEKHLRLSPLSASYFPENVVSMFKEGRAFYVFQGLDHPKARRGRVLRVQQEGSRWVATVLADLGSAPAAVLEELPGSWLVATSDGITRVTSRGTAQRLWEQKNVGSLSPSSIVRTSDGLVYVGMRSWVLRVRGLNPGPPAVDLLTPAACLGFEPRKGGPCPCSPAKDAPHPG
jgi:hypothetical protein